ncbi:hypothetical protein TNCV_2553351 [Trichonephila clavipes]|nr:hypothetical protein TNCV_2553351 [Trichonephila clavipes]
MTYPLPQYISGTHLQHPSGITVSDADCCAIGLGFKTRSLLRVLNPSPMFDVCKCIVPCGSTATLNSRRAASPLLRLLRGEKKWETLDPPRIFFFKLGWRRA